MSIPDIVLFVLIGGLLLITLFFVYSLQRSIEYWSEKVGTVEDQIAEHHTQMNMLIASLSNLKDHANCIAELQRDMAHLKQTVGEEIGARIPLAADIDRVEKAHLDLIKYLHEARILASEWYSEEL